MIHFEKALLVAMLLGIGCSKSTPTPSQTVSGEQRSSMSSTGVGSGESVPVVTQEEVMTAMKVASTPGEPHALLKPYVGTWTAVAKMWPAPNVTPQVSKGVMVNKSILGGRYLEQKYTGKDKEGKFEGQGVLGYDNLRRKYVSNWIDTMSTAQFSEEGVYDPAVQAFEMRGTMIDPVTKKVVATRTVTSMVDQNSYKFEMYSVDPAGNAFKSLEIVYTKPGAAKPVVKS